MGAIDAAALGPFEKKKSLLYILVVISLVGTISGKSISIFSS